MQLFFLNYAQIWCGSMRPEDAQSKILSRWPFVESNDLYWFVHELSNSSSIFSRLKELQIESQWINLVFWSSVTFCSVHSPGPIRVVGPLSNSREFAAAYNCKPGSRMNPGDKCSVWWRQSKQLAPAPDYQLGLVKTSKKKLAPAPEYQLACPFQQTVWSKNWSYTTSQRWLRS